MKFSLSWLHEHLDTKASLDEICTTLNRIGLEVEAVDNRALQLAGFRTAKILKAERHPDADRLQVCHVAAGPGFEDVQVVCGAPNACAGLHVIFAPPGTYIPGSGISIKAGKIRGQTSGGMLCSLRELGLGEESDGIAELPVTAPIGTSYAQYAELDDPVIEIAITPNRGDALSVHGIARDLAAAGLGKLRPCLAEIIEGQAASPVSWAITHPGCPYIVGRFVRGVKNGPSPGWLKKRLESVGISPHSALVDVTNYLMLAIGRPLHVFDAGKLHGETLTVAPSRGEIFQALNGQTYNLAADGSDIVLIDKAGVQSLAGIIGSAHSAVDENTKDVFIESGLFDAVSVALTGRRLSVQTDARYRFERGVDPAMVRVGLEAATALILEICGGTASEVTEAGAEPDWQREAVLHFERLKSLGGIAVEPEDATRILEHLGFGSKERDDEKAVFSVPSWRNDIAVRPVLSQAPSLSAEKADAAARHVARIEAEHDLVEEILRIHGLDQVPALRLPQKTMLPDPALSPAQARQSALRRLCVSRGLTETIGFSFVSEHDEALFAPVLEEERLLNPIASDLNQLRSTILVSLLHVLGRNLARSLGHMGEAAFFEIGPTFGAAGARTMLGAVRGGTLPRLPGHKATVPDWMMAKADLMAALRFLKVPEASLTVGSKEEELPGYYHPGRSGVIRQGPKLVLGWFGELHPRVARHFGLSGRVAVMELALDNVSLPKVKRKTAPVLSSQQSVRRDFAFLAGPDVPVQDVLRAVRMADRNLIEEARLFDIFEGGNLPAGYRSLGVEIIIQPVRESLTDKELEGLMKAVGDAVKKATGAELRCQ